MYIKCPRCMLNYINADTEQYCKVCLVDMKKIQGQPELDLDVEYKLCPECNENYLEDGEEICYVCRNERMKNDDKQGDENYSATDNGINDADDESLDVMAEMEDEEAEQQEEEESYE